MVCIVEMWRKSDDPELRFFSCSQWAWQQLQEIGKQYGWEPAGTEPDPYNVEHTRDYWKWFKPDYKPQEWNYARQVSKEDAGAGRRPCGRRRRHTRKARLSDRSGSPACWTTT